MHPPLLSNRYQTVRPIGTGRLTAVLEAWDRQTGRPVAIKVPIGQVAHDKTFLLRLERELAAMAGFTHPDVAAMLAVERGGVTGFVVVELVDGVSLPEVMADRGPVPPTRAAQLAATVCAALGAAHARGVVHGHLTPANLLLTADGQAKLTDFRIAKAAEPLPSAPDPGADLRALGRLLAVMLTGREPDDGEPIRLDPTVPAELAAIVARAVGPVEPYRSAAELGRDLDGFLGTSHLEAGTAGPPAAPAASDATDPRIAAAPSRSAALVAAATGSGPPRPAGDAAPAPSRRRRGPAVAAALIGAGLVVVVGTAVSGVMRSDSQPDGATVDIGQAMAPSTVLAATTSEPPASSTSTSQSSATTTPPTTAGSPAISSRPSATTSQTPGPGQRIVPNVLGLRREEAADVLARAQLGIESSPIQVSDATQVQRVVAQQPAAGQVVDAGSQVSVLVGTKRRANP